MPYERWSERGREEGERERGRFNNSLIQSLSEFDCC